MSIPSAAALRNFTHDQFRAAHQHYGTEWYEKINAAVYAAREAGDADVVEEGRIVAIVELMENYLKISAGDNHSKEEK